MYRRAVVALGIVLLGGSLGVLSAQDQPAKPDNTKVNKKDRSKAQPTADQQKENTSDRQLAANIRRAIVKDKSLSTYAHNIKVIVQGGNVTLKGPVHTEEEKKSVEAKAAEVAGSAKITNEITVKGDSAGASHKSKKKSTT